MPTGICQSFYNYKVTKGEESPKYYKLIDEIIGLYDIKKNTVYNIIKGNRNLKKCKLGLDLKIEKVKLPARQTIDIKY